jgi:hypothetical protein
VGAALSLELEELMTRMLEDSPAVTVGDMEWRRVRRAAEIQLMHRYPAVTASVQSRMHGQRTRC